MITYYSACLILATVAVGVRCQYLFKEYAPDHGNYESYSFAYGVSDPKSGDHKHQWERQHHGQVQGEYGLMEPDGLMRLVQYTAGPKEGFHATVTKLAVDVARPKFTLGRELYQNNQHIGYASDDKSGLGNEQPDYIQNKLENDYISEESQQHAVVARAPAEINTNKTRKVIRRKQIVKKNIENEMHSIQPGYTGMEYIGNFNLNPINIQQLNIPDGEKKILQGLTLHPQQIIQHIPSSFSLPQIHPGLVNFQKEIGNTQMHGYQINTNIGSGLINHQLQSLPTSIQDVKQQGGNSYGDKILQNALSSIHNHPEIQTRLEYLHNQYQIPKEQLPIQTDEEINYENEPRVVQQYQTSSNGNQQQSYEPESKIVNQLPQSYNQQNYETESRLADQQQYQTPLQSNNNQQYETPQGDNNQQQRYLNQQYETAQNNENQYSYGNYQQQHPEVYSKMNNLSKQNQYPVILVDPEGKLGLPFYPSSELIHQPPKQEYNYEEIPKLGPNLEGKRYNNENQTKEEKERERQYLLGETSGPLFPPPKGYTRETIWQAGDKDAAPDEEMLNLQLNQTCAYIQINETTPGNEDGKPNIWQAGDYSAQNPTEELIRSINITCDNYTEDAMNNFSSGYTILDYCYQCVKNDGSFYVTDSDGSIKVPNFIPQNFGPEKQENPYPINENQQVTYGLHDTVPNNSYASQTYGQNYETSGEKYQQVVNVSPQEYEHELNQGSGPMKVVIYQNLGYKNDPNNENYGLYKRNSRQPIQPRNLSNRQRSNKNV